MGRRIIVVLLVVRCSTHRASVVHGESKRLPPHVTWASCHMMSGCSQRSWASGNMMCALRCRSHAGICAGVFVVHVYFVQLASFDSWSNQATSVISQEKVLDSLTGP